MKTKKLSKVKTDRFTTHLRSRGIMLLAALTIISSTCGRGQVLIQERKLLRQNPTNFEFRASIPEVQSAIRKAFNSKWRRELNLRSKTATAKGPLYRPLQLQGASLIWKGDADTLTGDILRMAGNEDDAYLFGGPSCVGLSQVYFKDGDPLVYFANFHIHLASINASQTRVTIFTIAPAVVAGIEQHFAHGPAYVFAEVPPTSIEEYEILRRIGLQLGITNMPDVNIPPRDSPVLELQRPRRK